jgi:hypothetical protein
MANEDHDREQRKSKNELSAHYKEIGIRAVAAAAGTRHIVATDPRHKRKPRKHPKEPPVTIRDR